MDIATQIRSALEMATTTKIHRHVSVTHELELAVTLENAARVLAVNQMRPANMDTATLMAYTASGARQGGLDQTVKMLVPAFLGFPADIMDPASNLGANVNVNLAGWGTCAIARFAKFRANMAHAQTTQKNASATKIFMAKNVKGSNVCIFFHKFV